jgi:uncharacterized protein YciI
MQKRRAGAFVLAACLGLGAATHGAETPDEHRLGAVYLVLLKRGPAWTAEKTAATHAIQEAHMANIRAMWAAKKLIIAGPIGDESDLSGVLLFQVPTLEEAKALAATDPAVKAGRLVAEIHPWWVETRTLPEAGSYCTAAR